MGSQNSRLCSSITASFQFKAYLDATLLGCSCVCFMCRCLSLQFPLLRHNRNNLTVLLLPLLHHRCIHHKHYRCLYWASHWYYKKPGLQLVCPYDSRSYNTDQIFTGFVAKMAKLTVIEHILFKVMVDRVKHGKWVESKFKKEAWVIYVDQVSKFITIFGLVTIRKAKNKLDSFKAKWNM